MKTGVTGRRHQSVLLEPQQRMGGTGLEPVTPSLSIQSPALRPHPSLSV
jgi:hypothetical protein